MRTFLIRYLFVATLLAAALTIGFAWMGREGPPPPGFGIFLTLETPGAILRPDAWLFYHPALTGLVTSTLAALIWILPVFTAHALARAFRKSRSRPAV